MMIPVRILLVILICSFQWAGQAPCQTNEKTQVDIASAKKETLVFKDPFSPAVPKKKTAPKNVKQEIPTVPPVVPVKATEKEITPPTLSIQGLIWNTDRPQAIVNERVVGVGDSIEGAKIVGIHKTGISIVYEEKAFRIEKEKSLSTAYEHKLKTGNPDENYSTFPPRPPQSPEENASFDPGG